MGSLLSSLGFPYYGGDGYKDQLSAVPNHVLGKIISSGLDENDIASLRLVCKRFNWILSVIPNDQLPKLHVSRLGVECRFEGDDVIWVRQRNCSTVAFIHGTSKESTLRKLKRISCDELRLSGHQQSSSIYATNDDDTVAISKRRRSNGDDDSPSGYVAINASLFTTILESSCHTLTRVFIFRCSLFRFTEKDIAALANAKNLVLLSICHVSDANAVNDDSLLPVISLGTLEKIVLDQMSITSRFVTAIGRYCKRLCFLSVCGCIGVTEIGIGALTRGLKDGAKIICRRTAFDYMRFFIDHPQFRLSASGRALECPQKKQSIYFV